MKLEREVSMNRKIGPFLCLPFKNFVGSPMGAVPIKRASPVRWSIINDLSWPPGLGINDRIPKDLLSCRYDTMDSAIGHLKQFGVGALMSNLDLSDAFRHIFVHPDDWELLGSTWPIEVNGTITNGYFVDTFLPFGLRSSPAIFLRYGLRYGATRYLPCLALPRRFLDLWESCSRRRLSTKPRTYVNYLR